VVVVVVVAVGVVSSLQGYYLHMKLEVRHWHGRGQEYPDARAIGVLSVEQKLETQARHL
jgi:hypothetical protein